MGKNNCLRCNFRHTDNGNCTAVGGFCTAVPAAHCPLLRQYLDTGLTPAEVSALVKDWSDLCTIIGECGGIDRLREPAEADKDGRLVVLCGGISMTNADCIRDMNDEELARFLDEVQRQECEALHEMRPDGSLKFDSCQYGWLLWLKKGG